MDQSFRAPHRISGPCSFWGRGTKVKVEIQKLSGIKYQIKKMIKKIVTSTVLMPAMALSLYATPALASEWNWWNNDEEVNVNVTTSNSATVSNTVDVKSSTGGNDANGGTGSTAGDGGDVKGSDDYNQAGDGGNGGNGGDGGVIVTGDAYADALVANDLNYTRVKIDLCGCSEDDDNGDVNVTTSNSASVSNTLDVRAKTGYNTADGGDASECGCEAGDGGDVKYSDDHNHAGNGGNNGDAGWGGLISTGNATSYGTAFNTLNTTVVRIRR
jgi:hypothetical protein